MTKPAYLSFNWMASGQLMPSTNISPRTDLFHKRRDPCISASEIDIGISSFFRTDCKSTSRPASYAVIRRCKTFLSTFMITFLSFSLLSFLTVYNLAKVGALCFFKGECICTVGLCPWSFLFNLTFTHFSSWCCPYFEAPSKDSFISLITRSFETY